MSREESVNTSFWTDPEVEELSQDATCLLLWSWTNDHCGMAGLFKCSLRVMTESKVPAERLPAALAELSEGRFAFYEGGVLWVRARAQRLRSRSPAMARSIRKDVASLRPDHPLRRRFLAYYGDQAWLRDELAELVEESAACQTPDRAGEGPQTLSMDPLQTLPENGSDKPKAGTLSRPSPEGPMTGTGTGIEEETSEPRPPRRARAREAPPDDALPDDLDASLAAPARQAHLTLCRVAAAKPSALPVTLAAVGRAVQAFPTHDHPALAGEFEHYWCHGAGATRPMRDVVATYRNRLRSLPTPARPATPPVAGGVPGGGGARAARALDAWHAEQEQRVARALRGEGAA